MSSLSLTTTLYPFTSSSSFYFKYIMSTVVFDNVDVSSITLSQAKTSKAAQGCKTAAIMSGGSRLRIQTPVMPIPWDITVRQMDPGSNASCSMSLSFSSENEDEDVRAFKDFIEKVDVHIKQLASDMSDTLGKKADKKVIDGQFKESLKHSSNGDYAPTFQPKVWLKCRDGGSMKNVDDVEMELKVFNMDEEPISPSLLKKGCPAALIVQPAYVWCSALGVGITWVATECIVKPSEEKSCGFNMKGKAFDKYRTSDDVPSKKRKVDESEEESDSESQSSSLGVENEEEF